MTAEELLQLVRDRPFRPFRIIMVSRKAFEVHHPEVLGVDYDRSVYLHKNDLDKPSTGFDLLGKALIDRIEFVVPSVE